MIFCLFLFLCCKDNTKKWIKSNILQEKWTNGDKNIFFIAKRQIICYAKKGLDGFISYKDAQLASLIGENPVCWVYLLCI